MSPRRERGTRPDRRRWRGGDGTSAVEVVVALSVVGMVIAGSALAWSTAERISHSASETRAAWASTRYQVETILHLGHANAESGDTVVQGRRLSWTVTGTDPKEVVLVVERGTASREVVRDTTVFYLSGIR